MADYQVDRSLLESKSTEEILNILREERDDYTPEAVEILEEVLRNRGLSLNVSPGDEAAGDEFSPPMSQSRTGKIQIREPGQAIPVLNDLLNGVLNGKIDPQVGAVASNIVAGILNALEREFMTDAGEERSR
jgi:hypothetical protein